MPYIITTKQPMPIDGTPGDGSVRRAVATLEEAQHDIDVMIARVMPPKSPGRAEMMLSVIYLPESGGTVGPLPDGTVIEVERVGLNELRTGTGTLSMSRDELIVAYNAREASA